MCDALAAGLGAGRPGGAAGHVWRVMRAWDWMLQRPATRARERDEVAFGVLVTDLPLHPLNLWRFYNDRAAVELIIRIRRAGLSHRTEVEHPHKE